MADEPNEWRETVRDLYDKLHFGLDNVFTGNRLARRLIDLIEDLHPGYFVPPRDAPEPWEPPARTTDG